MEKITSLVSALQHNATSVPHLANLTLSQSEVFGWDYTACAISYNLHDPNAAAYLIHEYAHALLNHQSYSRDTELLRMERAAWDEAVAIAGGYGITISQDTIEDALDTYRNWLHSRSLCPSCGAAGVQTHKNLYRCLACYHTWRVNEARTCALKRYSTKNAPR